MSILSINTETKRAITSILVSVFRVFHT